MSGIEAIMHPETSSFTFTKENLDQINALIKRYPERYKRSALLPVLDIAQRQAEGWLPQPALEAVATILGLKTIDVLEVASFYTMYNLRPVGKFHIQVCGTTPCWLSGAESLRAACEQHLGIKNGGRTTDGLFSLIEVECLGACCNAPMVQINDEYYEDLTPDSLIKILESLKKGDKVTIGSQIGRKSSEPFVPSKEKKEGVLKSQIASRSTEC